MLFFKLCKGHHRVKTFQNTRSLLLMLFLQVKLMIRNDGTKFSDSPWSTEKSTVVAFLDVFSCLCIHGIFLKVKLISLLIQLMWTLWVWYIYTHEVYILWVNGRGNENILKQRNLLGFLWELFTLISWLLALKVATPGKSGSQTSVT